MRRMKFPRGTLNFPAASAGVILTFMACWLGLFAPASVGRAEAAAALSLEECLRIAEASHPNLTDAQAQIAVERGGLDKTAAADRLTVSGTASAERVGTSSQEAADYSAGASAKVKVFDANRNKYALDAQEKSLSGAQESARDTLLGVRANVKSAYMALLLNAETAKQRRESVDSFARHLEQARGFYEAGSNPWYDVTKAKVDLGNAELALVEAEGDLLLAKRELVNAMGVVMKDDFSIEPANLVLPGGAESGANELALANRPDYRASEMKVAAGRSTLLYEARGSSPTVSVVGGYNVNGSDIFDLDDGWSAGVQLSIPIVDGGATRAQVSIAKAQLMSLEAASEKLRQDILLDVGRALTDLRTAREQVRISALTLEDALENRKLAEGRYETGVGTPLEVTDALLNLTDAQLSSYNAQYSLQIAIINLESAVGVEFN